MVTQNTGILTFTINLTCLLSILGKYTYVSIAFVVQIYCLLKYKYHC